MGSVHKTPGFSKRPNFWIFRNNRCWFDMIFDDYHVILLDVISLYFIHVYTYITMFSFKQIAALEISPATTSSLRLCHLLQGFAKAGGLGVGAEGTRHALQDGAP